MPEWEDLDDFFDVEDFASVATFTPDSPASPFQVAGILNDAYSNPVLGSYELDTSKPILMCKAADINPDIYNPRVIRGMACTVEGINYVVRTIQPGDPGIIFVVLEFAE